MFLGSEKKNKKIGKKDVGKLNFDDKKDNKKAGGAGGLSNHKREFLVLRFFEMKNCEDGGIE